MAMAEERALASDKDLSDFAAKMDVPWRPKGMFSQQRKNAGVAVESWQTWFHFKKLFVFAYLFGMKHDFCRWFCLEIHRWDDVCSTRCHWEWKRRCSVWIKLATSTQKMHLQVTAYTPQHQRYQKTLDFVIPQVAIWTFIYITTQQLSNVAGFCSIQPLAVATSWR